MGAGLELLLIPLALYFVLALSLCRKLAARTTPALTWMFITALLVLPGGLIVTWWVTGVLAQPGS
ncbi:hypothetical protein DWB77_07245 [Streptomyces hundungensis]|uniref:Uncharacterized protein n=1 Tax=Streptomyces hundungensis TaxID=1077946 RepID=A0A387HNC1_9ACTN|nr:hypothetical protein DWB77_07245 [Streptomyces hundungensis]